jgi:hypothetical protein
VVTDSKRVIPVYEPRFLNLKHLEANIPKQSSYGMHWRSEDL